MIKVTALQKRDLAAVASLFAEATGTYPYRWSLSPQAFRDLALFDEGNPHAELGVDPEGWLVATEGDYTVGFAHCTVGRLAEDERDVRRGFLRSFIIRLEAPTETATALLTAADGYFRAHQLQHVDAFHLRTGYPCCFAGRGTLASDRIDLMAGLGEAGYRIAQRWLFYEKRTYARVIELQPALKELRLQIEDDDEGGFKLYLSQRITPVASLIVKPLSAVTEGTGTPTASLQDVNVMGSCRRKGIARWLGQRAINELVAQSVPRLVADVNHANEAGQSLLLALGFEELPMRGYSYTKSLSS